ncbi:MAG: cytochrome c [Candidatus Sericytochromatia bacterium]|nr:cytochrome c [Candidatus Sericytochromatia bacterium]
MFKKLALIAAVGGGVYLGLWQSGNPAEAAAGNAGKGKKIYAQNCAACHGKTGKADGPTGKALKPPPRDFSKGDFKYSKNDAELLAFIKKGKGAMPAWGTSLSDTQIQDVIAFIHTLKKK